MEIKYPDVKVEEPRAEALGMVGQVRKALKRAGVSDEEIQEFKDDALSGDYDHVIQTCMKWVTFG